MTLSFSLSNSSETLSLVPGVVGELGAKNPGLPGGDGFSELLNSLASIVPTQGIVTIKDGAIAGRRQDAQLPGGKDLPDGMPVLPDSSVEDEQFGGVDMPHSLQSATILPFAPVATAIAEASRPGPQGSAAAEQPAATTANATSTAKSLPGSAEADLPAASPIKIGGAGRSTEIAAPVSNQTGDIRVRIGPASEANRTRIAGAAPSAREATPDVDHLMVAPLRAEQPGKQEAPGQFARSPAAEVAANAKAMSSGEPYGANSSAPRFGLSATDLTGFNLSQGLASASKTHTRVSAPAMPAETVQATVALNGSERVAQTRSPEVIVARVNVTTTNAEAGETINIGQAHPIRRTSLLDHLSGFEASSRTREAGATATSPHRTSLEAKPTPFVQAAPVVPAVALGQVLPAAATATANATSALPAAAPKPDPTGAPATRADAAKLGNVVPASLMKADVDPFTSKQQGAQTHQSAPVIQSAPSGAAASAQQPTGQTPQAPQSANIVQAGAGATNPQATTSLQTAAVPQAASSTSLVSEPSSTESAAARGRPEILQTPGVSTAPVTDSKAAPLGTAERAPKLSHDETAETGNSAHGQISVSKPKSSDRAAKLPAKTVASKSDLVELSGAAEKAIVTPRTVSSVEPSKPLPTAIAAPVDGSFHTARPVSAVTPISTNDPFLNVERVVDQLMTARQLDLSKPTAISVAHREFGALTVTFDQQSTGNMNVEIAAETNEAQRALAAAMANDRGSSRQGEAVSPSTLTQNQTVSNPSDRGGMTNGGGSGLGQNSADDQRSQQSDQRGQHGERAAPRPQHQTPSRPDDALYA